MSDYAFTYRSDNFKPGNAADANFFLKAGKSEFSLMLTLGRELLAWKDKGVPGEFTHNDDLTALLSLPFKKMNIGLLPDALTLVPDNLFEAAKVDDFARFLDAGPADAVYSANFDAANHIIYKVDKQFSSTLAGKFQLNTILPADRGLAVALAGNNPADNDIYIDVSAGQVSLLNFNQGKLRFYNCFKAGDVNDALYYCLFVAKRLDLQPDFTTLIVSGSCPASDVEQLNTFFKTVKYNELRILDIPQGVPAHQLLSLAALA